jgi:hypothetical protein
LKQFALPVSVKEASTEGSSNQPQKSVAVATNAWGDSSHTNTGTSNPTPPTQPMPSVQSPRTKRNSGRTDSKEGKGPLLEAKELAQTQGLFSSKRAKPKNSIHEQRAAEEVFLVLHSVTNY